MVATLAQWYWVVIHSCRPWVAEPEELAGFLSAYVATPVVTNEHFARLNGWIEVAAIRAAPPSIATVHALFLTPQISLACIAGWPAKCTAVWHNCSALA